MGALDVRGLCVQRSRKRRQRLFGPWAVACIGPATGIWTCAAFAQWYWLAAAEHRAVLIASLDERTYTCEVPTRIEYIPGDLV